MSCVKDNEKIDKRALYKEKVALFKEHAEKHPERDLLELYDEWIAENSIYGIDRHKIWKRARKFRKMEPMIIKEGSEEWIRLKAVLDILRLYIIAAIFIYGRYPTKKRNNIERFSRAI